MFYLKVDYYKKLFSHENPYNLREIFIIYPCFNYIEIYRNNLSFYEVNKNIFYFYFDLCFNM
ncbi:hypothetical protein GCM10008909_14460 [Hathewaya limosa]